MSDKKSNATSKKANSDKKISKKEVKKVNAKETSSVNEVKKTKAQTPKEKGEKNTEIKDKKKVSIKKPDINLKSHVEKIKNVKIDKNFLMSPLFLNLLGIVFVLFAMFVAWDVRDGTINLDGLNQNVENNIHNNIKSLISQQVAHQYPNLNQVYLDEKVAKEYQKVLDSGEFNYNGQIIVIDDLVAQQLDNVKSQLQADNGQTYLTAIDPHFFLNLARNLAFTGHMGTSINAEGNSVFDLKLAPVGVELPNKPDFHVWLESKLIKLNGVSDYNDIGSLTKSVFTLSVIIATLSVIPIFFIIRLFANNYFALMGSLVLVTIGTFVSRTVAGFVDTDGYNVFFPLVIVAFLVYSFNSKNKISSIILALIAGFFQGMFIWAWGNGWFIFIFIDVALLGYLSYLIVIDLLLKKNIKVIINDSLNTLYSLIAFVIASFLFTKIFVSQNLFTQTFYGLTGGLGGITSFTSNIWPNVLSSVAELNAAGFNQIVASVGGIIIFLVAMVGLTYIVVDFKSSDKNTNLLKRGLIVFSVIWTLMIIKQGWFVFLTANQPLVFLGILFIPVGLGIILSLINKNKSSRIFIGMMLSIWILGTIYMSLNGVRFILLLAPAFATAFGIGMYYLCRTINEFIVSEINPKSEIGKNIGGIVLTGLLFFVLFSPMYTQAAKIGDSVTPNFDDSWYASMDKIRTNSNEDAIISSWWDFGHFFTLASQRGTTFDGGSQTTPRAHWIGRILMDNNETIAQDMLRMITCGGNEAHNTFLSFTNGEPKDAIKINKILYTTFGKNRSETRNLIMNNKYYDLDDSQVDSIMEYLSCEDTAENFFITSQDMIGKAGVWAHWGSWDFTKKYVHDNYKTLSVQEISKDIDENESLIQKYVEELKDIDIQSETENIKRSDLINQWFAPYPSYVPIQGQYLVPCSVGQNLTISCQHGLEIEMSGSEPKIVAGFEGQVKFNNIVYASPSGKIEVVEVDPTGDMDLVLIPSGVNSMNSLLAQHPLGASTFTKLFYLNGYGSDYFEKFDDRNSVTGNRIIVWKTLWESKSLNEFLNESDSSALKVESVNVGETEVNNNISNSSNN